MYKLSVIIPCYNYGDRVINAVKSVAENASDELELIVINDGSTDGSLEVLQNLSSEHSFQLIDQENMGLAATRNKGASIAKGEYILFLDADDELFPDVLVDVLKELSNSGERGLICFRHESIFVDRFPKKSSKMQFSESRERNFKDFILNNLAIVPSATLVNRQAFDKFKFSIDLPLSEDIPFFAQVIANYDCLYSDVVLTKMYKHSDSMRHDLERLLSSSYGSVDVLFDPAILPDYLFKYKNVYKAKRALSLFRSLRRQGEYAKAKAFYREAITLHPTFLFNLAYLKKFLLMFFLRR